MIVGVERPDASATEPFTSSAFRPAAIDRSPYRLHRLAQRSPALAAVVGLAAAAGIAETIAGSTGRASSIAIAALVLLAAAAGAAVRVGAGVARWLDALGRAFDGAGEAQLIAVADGRTVQANLAFERLVGGVGEMSLDAVERMAADGAAVAALRMLRARAAGGAAGFAAVTLRDAGGGQPRRYEISVEPGLGRRGYPLWRLVDRTETAAVDAPAAASGEAAVAPGCGVGGRFFADAPVGIGVVDRDGRFLEANGALGDLLDTRSPQLIGCELAACLDPTDRPVVAAKLAAAAAGIEDRSPVEIRSGASGERVLVMLLAGLDRAPDAGRLDNLPASAGGARGKACGAAAGDAMGSSRERAGDGIGLYFIDVTERKQLEAQFAQSQKMQAVGQLAGGMAHDFNNLLTAMLGFCDLLLMRARPGDPLFGDLMQIKQNANRAADLVRQLLAFSRRQSLQPQVLDVTGVLAELSHLLRRLIGENIALEVIHDRDLGLVEIDRGQLEQVVINLAVNARDAMPEGGRLTIRTVNLRQSAAQRRGSEIVPAGDYVSIEIADTGVGIAPADLGRIFEPFFSTKAPGRGTGLGLSTVYGIVKQSGGFVFADSALGVGTILAIYLPRHFGEASARIPLPSAEPPVPRDLTGTATVLLVEDDDAVRLFAARALRNKGYRVLEAEGSETALRVIRDAGASIDLLISDVVMPLMDGPALIREVRQQAPRIKVVFISGYAEDTFRGRLDSGSDIHFLPKPFSLKQLAVKVKEVITGDCAAQAITGCTPEQIGYNAPPASRCTAAPAVK